jgi:hypothetical protein
MRHDPIPARAEKPQTFDLAAFTRGVVLKGIEAVADDKAEMKFRIMLARQCGFLSDDETAGMIREHGLEADQRGAAFRAIPKAPAPHRRHGPQANGKPPGRYARAEFFTEDDDGFRHKRVDKEADPGKVHPRPKERGRQVLSLPHDRRATKGPRQDRGTGKVAS